MRKKILKIKKEDNLSIEKVARRFGISPTTVVRWMERLQPKMKRCKEATKVDMKILEDDVKENPDLYQYERAAKLKVCQSTVCYALKRLGVSYKKNLQTPKSKRRKADYV